MEPYKIKTLFARNDRTFMIPPYQRAYSWEAKTQVKQFMEDIKDTQGQYYLGHFLFEDIITAEGGDVRLIIDGQQRLTTCVIFFSALHAELKARIARSEQLNSIDIDDIKHNYVKDLRKNVQRFQTVFYDNNFFLNDIIDCTQQGNTLLDTTSQLNIRNARLYFERAFKATSTDTLLKWRNILENAVITEYVVTNKTLAVQIFAFQNDRGKELSKLEIVKAYLMLQICLASPQEQLLTEIKYLESNVALFYHLAMKIKRKENEVLSDYWRSISGKGFASEEVLEGVKQNLPVEPVCRLEWIRKFSTGLVNAFKVVLETECNQTQPIMDLLYLDQMSLSYPFLFRAHSAQEQPTAIARLINLLENITFRYLLRGGRAAIETRLNVYLQSQAGSMSLGELVDRMVRDIKTNGWWSYWNDNSITNCLRGWMYENRVDNYLLWKYELHISDGNHPRPHNISFRELIGNESIEHIAPKTPTDGDPVANGYGLYNDKEHPEQGIESGLLLNCIGNLMLISQSHNSSIGNKAFSAKLDSYGKDNLLNQQKEISSFVAKTTEPVVWDYISINNRRDRILKAALAIWDLNRI